ncbi:MAG: T9SS type A sorting domain-containing protein [Bacteroidetes bacterium]|nr:T9SS type A sorting domain-containing protein [Bacteroidota bacterium]
MKHLYLTLLGLYFVFNTSAQITITSASMPGNGDTARVSNAVFSSIGNYTVTGANYTWHFDSLKLNTQTVRNFKSGLLTPYAFYFSSPSKYGEKTQDSIGFATFKFKNIYSFYKKTTAAFSAEGIGFTYSGIPLAGMYSDEDELYQFPLNYADHDSSTFKFKVSLPTIGFYGKQGYRINDVDGWGTVYTPFGSASCIRVVSTQYSIDSIGSSFGNFGFPNNMRSYLWLTTTEKVPFLEVTGNLVGSNFTPTQIRYRDSARYYNPNPFGVSVQEFSNDVIIGGYPNPAHDNLTLSIKASDKAFTAEIFDLSGKMVLSENLGICSEPANKRMLHIQNLSPGLYLLRINNGKVLQTFRFSKQ